MPEIKKHWSTLPEPLSESSFTSEYEADVVILGAGHAGASAIRAAAEAGASVIAVEQQFEDRFNVYGAQYGSINSKYMRDKGVPEYDPIDIMLDWQKRSLNRANPELIRKFAYTNGDTFDWFLEAVDDEVKEGIKVFMWPQPKYFEGELNGYKSFVGTAMFSSRQNTKMLKENGGKMPMMPPPEGGEPGEMPEMPEMSEGAMPPAPMSLTDAVVCNHDRAKALGAQFFYGFKGDRLEKDENGRVVALICKDHNQQYIRFKAKNGVILAAGDFGGNREMVNDLLTELVDLTGGGEKHPLITSSRTGMGIRMGVWAGGVIEPAPRGGMWCCVAGNGGPMDGTAMLKLNCKGKRYGNEGFMGYWGQGVQGARQPNGPIMTVWDSNWAEELHYQSLDHSSVDVGGDDNSLGHIRMQLERAIQKGGIDDSYRVSGPPTAYKGLTNRLVAADTLEELAERLGLDETVKKSFLQSIERYNELCDKGRDEDYAKDARLLHPIRKGPFFCFEERHKAVGNLMVSVAGLMVDGDQKVLDKDYEPIPGLYATGNCSGGRFPIMYTTPVGGVSIGIAHCLGRIVGDFVARNED